MVKAENEVALTGPVGGTQAIASKEIRRTRDVAGISLTIRLYINYYYRTASFGGPGASVYLVL